MPKSRKRKVKTKNHKHPRNTSLNYKRGQYATESEVVAHLKDLYTKKDIDAFQYNTALELFKLPIGKDSFIKIIFVVKIYEFDGVPVIVLGWYSEYGDMLEISLLPNGLWLLLKH